MIILDLDNCIADDSWRIPRISWQHTDPLRRYHDYHQLSAWDTLQNADIAFHADEIAIFTGRPIMFRTITEEWLLRRGVKYRHLLMRNDNDFRPSEIVKLQQLNNLLSVYDVELSDITMAYDDRPEIVQMYWSSNVPAQVRAIHSIDAYRRAA